MNKNTLTITTTAKAQTAKIFTIITVLLLTVGLVTTGCGGGGGGGSVVSSGGGAQTGTLSGTIVLPGGADPGGALVIATKMSDDGTKPASAARPKAGRQLDLKAAGGGSYVTVTDSAGNYTFPDIEEGSYFVVATKGAYKASNVATVTPSSATVVDLSLTPTGQIRGQVLLSGTDASTGDLSGTLAMVVGTSYIAATDTDGTFIVSQIPVSSGYQVMFTRPGYETLEYAYSVTVTAARTTTLDTVTLVVDSGVTGSIGGVLLRPSDDDPDMTHEGILISITGTQFMAITDYDGNWIIHGVPVGIYSVAFGDLGGNLGDEHITLDGIEITAGELTEMPSMTLQPTGLEGKVTLQGGGAAVGAMVKIQELGSDGFSITSSEGDYYILGVDPGTYTVAAMLDGYTPKVEENVVVEQGTILTLNFELVPSGTTAGAGNLDGTVYVTGPPPDSGTVGQNSQEQIPMKHAEVLLMGTNFISIANEEGQYSMRGVPAGTYDLYVDGDEDGLDTELTIKDIAIVAGETTTQDAVLIDSESPEIWGMYGVQQTEEVDVTGSGTAMRLFFQQAYDVSGPVLYNVYYAPAESWDQDDWSQNQVMSVPEGDVGSGDDGEGPVFVDLPDLEAGVEYAFGVRLEDYWNNEDGNDIIHFAIPSGGQDIFPPKWDDESRVGIQAAYALEDEPGAVAVEFESAHDGYDGNEGSSPVVYNIYFAPVNEFDEQDWSNNDELPVPEDKTLNGSYYQRRVDIHYLTPGTAYTFGVRAADSAETPNEEQNGEIRVAIPAGGQAGAAHHLEFGRTPDKVLEGETWPGFGVVVVDEDGIIITEAIDSVTVGLDEASNLSGLDGTLSNTTVDAPAGADPVPGVAIFYDISYSTALTNLPERIVLEATADGLLGASIEIEVTAPDSDGDGVPDSVDQTPNDATSANPPAATETGPITVDVSDTQGATLSEVSSITADDPFNQAGRPTGVEFPDGLVFFNVENIQPGATVPVTITFPTTYPDSAKYYKVDENGFHEFQDAVINGNTVTLNLTDGGAGDTDGEADGTIHDPGGVAVIPVQVPTLGTVTTGSITSTSITASCQVTDGGGAPVTEVGFIYGTGTGDRVIATLDGSSFSTTITGLARNTQYTITAYAVNSAGEGESVPIQVPTPAEAPSPPINVQATEVTDTSIAVTAGAPVDDGGLPIAMYAFNIKVVGGSPTSPKVSQNLLYTFTGLTPDTQYEITVLANNTRYYSDPSDPIQVSTLLPAPAITSFVADDPDDGDSILSAGDTLTIAFDQAVNMTGLAASDKAELDGIFSFTCVPGASYSGVWSQDSTSVTITIDDATGGECTIGASRVSVNGAAGLKNNDNSSAVITAMSPPLTGNWGVAAQGPTAAADTYNIQEDEPLNVAAAQGVLSNDTPASGGNLTVTELSGPAHAASFTLNPDGSFAYTPEANYNGTDVFTYELSEAGGSTNQTTALLNIAAVNDPPTISVPGNQDADQGVQKPITGISVADVDAGTDPIQVAVMATQTGSTLNMTIASGVQQSGNGGANVQLMGSLDALNQTLSTLTYQNDIFTGDDVLTVQVNDMGNTGTGGSLYGQQNITITVY